MAKDKWVIEPERYSYRIQWFLATEGEMGAYFGDGPKSIGAHYEVDLREPASETKWLRVHNLALDKILKLGLATMGSVGARFETMSDAKQALAIIKDIERHIDDTTPWPDWALKAQAAGWKAPKGWKP